MFGVRVLAALPIPRMPTFSGFESADLESAPPAPPAVEGMLRARLAPLADPPDAPLRSLLSYGRMLLSGNAIANLTGAKDWETLADWHLADCLEAARFIPEDARCVADWGSGGGLPGLVWSILFPEKRVLLVEGRDKRAAFLEEAALRLELFQAEVVHGRGEERLPKGDAIDLLTARAVEKPELLLARIRRARVPLRSLLLFRGHAGRDDWDAIPADIRASWSFAAEHRYTLGPAVGERALWMLTPRRSRRP